MTEKQGVVTKANHMNRTITVTVHQSVRHPLYKKSYRLSKKFLVHNPGNTAQVGAKVTIKETRPISKNKHFIIVKQSDVAADE